VLADRRSEEDYFAPATFRTAIRWLERHHRERFFLLVDTWDPHEPWDPPEYYVRLYRPDYSGQRSDPCYWDYEEDGLSREDVDIGHACYSGEITMVDHWFGILMSRIESLDLLRGTAVIFLSDHGFYFGEHGLFGKRRFRWDGGAPFTEGYERGLTSGSTYRSPLHQEITRVPLLMYVPQMRRQHVSGLVCLPDVAPTILELAGLGSHERMQGRSLLPLVRGEVDRIHDLVVSSAPLEKLGWVSQTVDDRLRKVAEISPSSITDGVWDFLYAAVGEPVELYRTQEDPGHTHNVAAEYPEVVERLHAQFLRWLQEAGTPEDMLALRMCV
jgi:arylsulfatase A-like enzyme